MALTYITPSGWEFNSGRLASQKQSYKNPSTYEDIRDDRVNLFYSLEANSTKVFKFNINAQHRGNYYLPAIQTEDMYNHDIRARIAGYRVNVKGYGDE